jgi:hypothetical protein
MTVYTQVRDDDPLMIAWNAYKRTESYANSFSWATRFIPEDDPEEVERVRASGANHFGREQRIKAVEGSLWSAFMHGFRSAPASPAALKEGE